MKCKCGSERIEDKGDHYLCLDCDSALAKDEKKVDKFLTINEIVEQLNRFDEVINASDKYTIKFTMAQVIRTAQIKKDNGE